MAGDWIFSAANQRIRLLKWWQMESAQVETRGNWRRVFTARVSLMSSALASLSLCQVERPRARAPPTHHDHLSTSSTATTLQVSPQPLTETFLDFSFFTFDCHRWQFWQSSHHLGLEPRKSHMVQLPGLTWRKFTASPCFPKNVTTPKCLEEKLLVI